MSLLMLNNKALLIWFLVYYKAQFYVLYYSSLTLMTLPLCGLSIATLFAGDCIFHRNINISKTKLRCIKT